MIETEKFVTTIAGVWLQPLGIIQTEGGPVLHMLKQGYALTPESRYGEIYFSEIFPGCVKAWKRHKRQTQLFAVPAGEIRISLYDTRTDSPTFGNIFSTQLGRPDNYRLLSIPPDVWYGFKAISSISALICNCADLPHDPREAERLPPNSDLIPYSWN